MTKYLISFPADAMTAALEDMPAVGEAARAVVEEAKAAGVYLFAGGIDEGATPVRVSADGAVLDGAYPGSRLNGGFTALELPTREDAVLVADKLAFAGRCVR